MTYRNYDGATCIQKFDVENPAIDALDGTFRCLVAITHVLASSAIVDTQTLSVTQFIYPAKASGLRDGDGNRVKTIYPNGSWTAFIGDHYEVDSDGKTRSYYFLGAQRIAMRIDYGETDVLYFFHTDHLGSTSLLSDENGDYVDGTEARYLPYGGYRIEPTADLTDHGFTGHKQQDEVGLIYMRARFYVPGLGRFLSADTIVPDPGNPQNLNRYSYVSNNPLKYLDPSGHMEIYQPEGVTISPEDMYKRINIHDYVDEEGNWVPRYVWVYIYEPELFEDYPITYFDVSLSAEEANELLEFLEYTDDIFDAESNAEPYIMGLGSFLEIIGVFGKILPSVSIPAGIVDWLTGAGLAWTSNDIENIKNEVAKASNWGEEGIDIRMGTNLIDWKVDINGEEISRSLYLPDGFWNGTRLIMESWYIYIYQQTPLPTPIFNPVLLDP